MIMVTMVTRALTVMSFLSVKSHQQKKEATAAAKLKQRWLVEDHPAAAKAAAVAAVAVTANAVKSSMKLTAHSRIFAIKFVIFKIARSNKMLALPISRLDLKTMETPLIFYKLM